MKTGVFGIALWFLFTACTGREQGYLNPGAIFNGKDTLFGEVLKDTLQLSSAISRIYYTDKGLVCCSEIKGKLIQLLDTLNGRMIACVGNKEDEKDLKSMTPLDYDALTCTFGSYDLFRHKVIRWEITRDSLRKKAQFMVQDTILASAMLNDSVMTLVTYFPGQSVKLVNLNSREVLDRLPYCIIEDNRIDFNKYYFVSYLNITPDKKKIVVTGSRYSSLRIYSPKGNKLRLVKDYTYFNPDYSVEDGGLKIEDNHIIGGGTTKVTGKYIYIRTHGLSRGEERRLMETGKKVGHTYLLVFDLEGNYVRSYLFDKRFYTFDITPDDKTVYAVVGEPYIHLVKYSIPRGDPKDKK